MSPSLSPFNCATRAATCCGPVESVERAAWWRFLRLDETRFIYKVVGVAYTIITTRMVGAWSEHDDSGD